MAELIYLDTGEIFEADAEGFPAGDPVAALQHGVLDDDAHKLGQTLAAAPDLLIVLTEGVRLYERELLHMLPSKEARAFLTAARDLIAKTKGR